MKTLRLVSMFATLAGSLWYVENNAIAQQGKPGAKVTEVIGVCQVRDSAEAKPQAIKVNDNLRADQEVLCSPGGRIRFRYESTLETREIGPRWLKVGSAAVGPQNESSPGGTGSLPAAQAEPGGGYHHGFRCFVTTSKRPSGVG